PAQESDFPAVSDWGPGQSVKPKSVRDAIISQKNGKDSKVKKTNRMKELLAATTDCEPLYLTRLLQANLRLSFSGQIVLAALGQASVYNKDHSKPPPNAESIVKQVFAVFPAYDVIVSALLSGGVWNLLKNCNFTLGVPISFMLAKPTTSLSEVLDRFQDTVFTCEYKYDGQRQQIHYMEDGTFQMFSRNGKRNTGKYPDVARVLSRLKKPSVKSFILDCEVVAFDREAKKLLPFQTLSTRAHKNVNVSNIKVGGCTFAFDMLYLNGQQLIHESLDIRREKLYESFDEDPGYFQFATAMTSSDVDEIQKFLKASVDSGCEGLMIKTLNSNATYEPAKRANNWLKLKKDYMDRQETLWILYQLALTTGKANAQVWEVKAADLTISPKYLAANGIVDPNKFLQIVGLNYGMEFLYVFLVYYVYGKTRIQRTQHHLNRLLRCSMLRDYKNFIFAETEEAKRKKMSACSASPLPILTFTERAKSLSQIQQAHAFMLKNGTFQDTFSASKLIAFAVANPEPQTVSYAHSILNRIESPNAFTHNSVIRAYANSSTPEVALSAFREMLLGPVFPDKYSFTFVLKACAAFCGFEEGRQIHGLFLKSGLISDVFVENTLVNVYGRSGCFEIARKVLDRMPERDVVSWNSLLSAYVEKGLVVEARALFDEMEERNVESWNFMISGYSGAGLVNEARELFDSMPVSSQKNHLTLKTKKQDEHETAR
ncbi:unnamed protein product, partial [Thlaspi arvense]